MLSLLRVRFTIHFFLFNQVSLNFLLKLQLNYKIMININIVVLIIN